MIHQEINVLQLEQKHESDYQKSLSIPVRVELPIEIDSDIEFDTELFRVWYGHSNLGIFRLGNQGWLAEPFYGNPSRAKTICVSADEARDVIVAAYQAGRGI